MQVKIYNYLSFSTTLTVPMFTSHFSLSSFFSTFSVRQINKPFKMQILIFKIIESLVQEKHETWKKIAIQSFGISLCWSLWLIISQGCMEEQWWEQGSGKDVQFISIYCFLDWWRQVTPSFSWLCLYLVLQSSVFLLWASYTLHFYLVCKVTITGKICKVLCDLFRARTP